MEKVVSWAVIALIGLVIAVAIGVLTALPVMLLWNAVIPELFGLKAIGFIQALLLSTLCSLLFKSSGGSSSK
jgi:hypothetical protein